MRVQQREETPYSVEMIFFREGGWMTFAGQGTVIQVTERATRMFGRGPDSHLPGRPPG